MASPPTLSTLPTDPTARLAPEPDSIGPRHRPTEARFVETHERIVEAPVDVAWRAALDVTAAEVRWLGPLMSLRSLPARLLRRDVDSTAADDAGALLHLFEREGFVPLHRHDEGAARRVEFGAVGRFWSPTQNRPVRLDGPADYAAFAEPGNVRIWFELGVAEAGAGARLFTTTCVTGTDPAAERRFAPYWAVIRLPSGMIRRSWLAAIDRRARS